ncbi:unnamed protein product [Adineta steineri]|uniref:G-protein coupled receptors family 1 profile domain-containing protein n=1 Tax=Adineta steineri TaxID=433720 RepID=A0A818UF52_9BILA|nr:unnamed protein product [Adineta steineri]CAF1068341.1 unnamed protein product [Adineta steineri]CAF3699713.1 unnamed protein product [Adineta steineri]CAF3901365.1 unnamed protein product [Adineta steineri]
MAIPLLSISLLYIILYCPPMFLYTAYLAGLSQNIAADYYAVISSFNYFAISFTPIMCALSLSELRTKFKICFPCCRRRRATVGPQALMMTRTKAGPAAGLTAGRTANPTAGPTAAIATIAQ